MMRCAGVAAALACVMLVGCGDGDAPASFRAGVERFGLIDSPVDYPLVLSAIGIANTVVADGGRRFAPGWDSSGTSANVPVFAVRGQLASREIMVTYPECGCVVVQASALDAWLKAKEGTGTALLAVEPRLILSYMLLHEVGHLARDSAVEDATPFEVKHSAVPYNLDPTSQKRREVAADGFAADAVRAGLAAGGQRGVAAGELSMALSQLSWNLAAHRLLDEFGGTAVRKPSLFQDAGTSHPNLEWRILVVNDLIADTEVSRQLLEDFEKAAVGSSSVLWRSPG